MVFNFLGILSQKAHATIYAITFFGASASWSEICLFAAVINEEIRPVARVDDALPQPGGDQTVEEVDTEFLTPLYAELDVAGSRAASPAIGDLAVFRIANQLAANRGAPPLTMQEV